MNDATILILQDRSIGLETLQDDLRRHQIFPLFLYASNIQEFKAALARKNADLILLVQRYFTIPFDDVLHMVRGTSPELPIIVILPEGRATEGMDLLKRGAQDYLLETELDRLPASVFSARRLRSATPAPKPFDLATPAPVVFERASNERPLEETLIGSIIDIVTEVDLMGTILYESPSIFDQLGYTQEELIGRNAFSLIHPMDVPKVMPVFMLALASPGIPHSARFRFRHKNGSWRVLESVGKSILPKEGSRHVIVTSRVFKEELRPRANLGDSEALFMDVVEGLGEGVLVTDSSDKILYANRQMAEFTGYDVSNLLGQLSYKVFLPEEAWPIYMEQKEKWLLGNKEEYELSIPRKDGVPLCMHVNVSPYRDSEGRIVGTLTAFTDITKRKLAEEEVQRTFASLHAAKDRAEEMNRLKTNFLNNVSHEIRTPLNSILGFSSILSDSLEGTEFGSYARTIETSGKRLLETIEGILDLSRLESNTVSLVPRRISLEVEARRIVSLLELQAREKGIAVYVDAESPVQAYVDVHYLGRVLMNVVGNAIKFTPSGNVRIVLSNNADTVEIKIIDTGIGISEEFLPHLFEEFYQESDGLARTFEGTGVGLRIAKRLVELMGGSISAESEKGKGSTFTISLPLNMEQAAKA